MASGGQAELIVSTIAVVLDPSVPPLPNSVRGDRLEAILRRPLNVSQGPEGPIITSSRDQIEIQLPLNKVDVRESSGDVTQARDKIPRVIHQFLDIALPEKSIQSYGINFILEIDLEGPHEWLGNRLLNQNLASQFGTSLSSNMIAVSFDQTTKKWTVRFQALPNDGLNVNFNASEITDALPGQETLGHELEEQYRALNEFLSQLGLQT